MSRGFGVEFGGQAGLPEVLIQGDSTRGDFSIGPNPTVFGAYQPLVGDFVGGSGGAAERYSDIVWCRPGTNPNAFWQGESSGTFVNLSANINGYYQPLVANFNCDDWSDIVQCNPASNSSPVWYGGQSGFFDGLVCRDTGRLQRIDGRATLLSNRW